MQYQLNNGEKELLKNASEPQIKVFSKVFCKTLNSVYRAEEKEFRLFKILDAGKYFALHFRYTDDVFSAKTEQTDDLERAIQEIIPTQKRNGKSSHTQRILKIYGKDTIILSKPKQLKYWLQSIAFRDADETFAAYIKTRYS